MVIQVSTDVLVHITIHDPFLWKLGLKLIHKLLYWQVILQLMLALISPLITNILLVIDLLLAQINTSYALSISSEGFGIHLQHMYSNSV